MAQVNAKYTKYNQDGSLQAIEIVSIDLQEDDRVLFVDNSGIDDCITNCTGPRTNKQPAGWQGGPHYPICGTIVRTNAVQEANYDLPGLGKRHMELPIVVLGDDDSIIYCNTIHIRKL